MMNKNQYLTICLLCIWSLTITAQAGGDCSFLESFCANTSLANSCEEFKTYAVIKNLGTLNYSASATWDFGDGTTPLTTTYPVGTFGPGPKTFYPETTHSYVIPGTYNATLTVVGQSTSNAHCPTQKMIVAVNVSGVCETCSTYSVLSTGYDPATNLPMPVSATLTGAADPNWTVLRRFNLAAGSYTPIPSTQYTYTPAQPTVIYPAAGYCPNPPLGRSRFISTGLTNSTANIYTYRRYFTLPSTLPSSSMYSMLMNIRADGYLFDVQLNGASILSSSLMVGSATQLNINSCSGAFSPGSNFIDITVADNSGGPTTLDAEVMLYECPAVVPCTGSGGTTYSWSWNTNWGYGWYYYWAQWYCSSGGTGGFCPPSGGPGNGGAPGGSNTGSSSGAPPGWGWYYVSGWGYMWLSGGNSGSGSISCPNCISSFAPTPGKKYLLSAWVKEKNPAQSKTSYTYPTISVLFPAITTTLGPFSASGGIIDGWQRLEAEFVIPSTATDMSIKLDCNTSDCYYDDIRVLPFDGSMKSYVYDPVNMRLVAELDERNFATLYEYDEEGKLIRVKKETEKGKMTIKENRNSSKK